MNTETQVGEDSTKDPATLLREINQTRAAVSQTLDCLERKLTAGQLLDQQPDSRDLNFLVGASLLTVGRPEKAVGHLENSIRQDSQFLPAHAVLGRALLRAGKATEAIPHLKATLTIDEDGSGHFQLLRAYQITGQTDLARHALAEYQAFQKLVEAKARFEDGRAITR